MFTIKGRATVLCGRFLAVHVSREGHILRPESTILVHQALEEAQLAVGVLALLALAAHRAATVLLLLLQDVGHPPHVLHVAVEVLRHDGLGAHRAEGREQHAGLLENRDDYAQASVIVMAASSSSPAASNSVVPDVPTAIPSPRPEGPGPSPAMRRPLSLVILASDTFITSVRELLSRYSSFRVDGHQLRARWLVTVAVVTRGTNVTFMSSTGERPYQNCAEFAAVDLCSERFRAPDAVRFSNLIGRFPFEKELQRCPNSSVNAVWREWGEGTWDAKDV
ncbi:Amino acid--[acyl-carrier-protein] ligase 1 [Frankliniella fusca]|uniref:Amino acid--[acyl-carrier-protein] ligase 1 n=1 Tax=Frankliniella fusca TaxID=407009 RepID=A0AAE1L872_9NEOP|nr:Amino acid--[acyl-carrier-protein] ligase 1 [Frankliniella fusca]